ncbi:MAG TPA: hypothetical protein VK425_05460 [Acidimicrobiales bacterium]|nr:hypothetical protein [Acidimicrobiales bacterium]
MTTWLSSATRVSGIVSPGAGTHHCPLSLVIASKSRHKGAANFFWPPMLSEEELLTVAPYGFIVT